MLDPIINFVMAKTWRVLIALAIGCFSGAALVVGSLSGALVIAGVCLSAWALIEMVAS